VSPLTRAHDHVLSAIGRAHSAYLALAEWASAQRVQPGDGEQEEAGNYSTEMVVIIAGIVLLAVALLAVITKKVLDKADSINF
jgi:hypothetical protein